MTVRGPSFWNLLLLAAGLSLLVSAELSAQALPPNHFKCYETDGKPLDPPDANPIVFLRDQFDPAGVPPKETRVFKAVRFCNPVEKTTPDGLVTPIGDELLHLTLYLTAPTEIAPARRVVVRNQFGRQRINVYSAIALAVPTQKNDEPASNNRDHYKCYSAIGASKKLTVGLKDQFGPDPVEATVLRPRLFCNPSEKKHGDEEVPIENTKNHLLCYSMTTSPFTGVVLAANQFERAELLLGNADLLCVPSEKLRVSLIP